MTRHRFIILTFLALTSLVLLSCHSNKDSGKNRELFKDSLTTPSKHSDDQPLIARLIKNTDSDFFYGDTTPTRKICSQRVDYLGDFQNQKDETTFKIMTIQTEWGFNCRLTTIILVYSKTEEYLGYYYTNGILPTHIMSNGLVFDGVTIGDFSNGVPDSLQIDVNYWTTFQKKNGPLLQPRQLFDDY
ncbi:MAG: hypothetical protein AB7G44_06145 [Bacteroidia bacterium]